MPGRGYPPPHFLLKQSQSVNFKLLITLPLIAALSGCVINHSSKPDAKTPGALGQKNDKVERFYFNDWETDIGYAQAVKHGNILYVSGVPAGGKDMSEAMQKAYQRIAKILEKFNATPDDIVKETIFTKDMEATKKAIPARKAFFSENLYPAATWVEVNRFFNEELLLEVDVTVSLKN